MRSSKPSSFGLLLLLVVFLLVQQELVLVTNAKMLVLKRRELKLDLFNDKIDEQVLTENCFHVSSLGDPEADMELVLVNSRGDQNIKRLMKQQSRVGTGTLLFSEERIIQLPVLNEEERFDTTHHRRVIDSSSNSTNINSITADWNRDRLDQRYLPLDGNYTSYEFATLGNVDPQPVHVYIVDTGVYDHADLPTHVQNDFNYYPSNPEGDCNVTGHGTHIAGIISSTSHGVAHSPNVLLHSIKVLDCAGSGTTSGLAAGLIWIQQHLLLPAVINLSLSMSGTDVVLEAILSALRTAGALIVTAAGNSASDACNFFPAGSPSVITVGSSSVPVHQGVTSEQVSSFSNYGSCVEIYAPGESILSLAPGGAYSYKSGTSMAAPAFVGVVILRMLKTNFGENVFVASEFVVNDATTGVLSNFPSNRLLYARGSMTSSVPSPTPAPTSATPTRAPTPAPTTRPPIPPPPSPTTNRPTSSTIATFAVYSSWVVATIFLVLLL